MRRKETFENRDKLIQLGLTIATYRKIKGYSQEQLAEKADISRSFLSSIETPSVSRSFSVDILFNIADALDMEPYELLKFSMFSKEDN